MFIELHLLQNFAPACLNRDDTNSPKDCEFGGYRRARISSQCTKRAIRRHFREARLLPPDNLAVRSKRLISEIVPLLVERGVPRDPDIAARVAATALAAAKIRADDNETQYLLFLGHDQLQRLATVIHENWEALVNAVPRSGSPETEGAPKKKTAKQQKAEAQEAIPAPVAKEIVAVLRGSKAADLALFGRMLADQKDLSVDAACQVAHAFSTNKVSMELDFYTAVDDLKQRDEDTGAGMLGTVEFNSSCFYRYANLDFAQLRKNLQGDGELARATVRAFLQASIEAIPTGKQNSMAAHNPPSLILAIIREHGLWSLANAFVQPVSAKQGDGLVDRSAIALDTYWGRLVRMYGDGGIMGGFLCCENDDLELPNLARFKKKAVSEVVAGVLEQIGGGE
jgi:CRISPR system Cascade subunit CasC